MHYARTQGHFASYSESAYARHTGKGITSEKGSRRVPRDTEGKMNTDQWASHDQFTSFAKEPWGFNRPENLKEHSVLSKATFAEWPNTTSDFALRRGIAPTGKLAAHHKSRFESGNGREKIPSPTPREETKDRVCANTPSCAISDAQLRASVNTTCGSRPAGDYARRIIATGEGAPPSASKGRAAARHSADDVTAAYTLLQQHAAAQERVPPRTSKTRRCTPTTTSAGQTAVAALPIAAENEQSEGHDASRGEQNHNAVSSNWSVTNIGFNDIKSEARARIERENRDGYVRAAFASQHADRSYLAEAAHFRFRYPHTLGRIAALSHVRSDRVNARSDRTRSVSK